jgi:hypothetical protein
MLRDATLTSFLEILFENHIPFRYNKAESILEITDSGSTILLRSLDQFERLRGTNLAWFGIDELTYTREEAWLRLESRLRDPKAIRLCGFAVWTPKGFDWVYERFVRNRVEGYEAVPAQPYENRHVLDRVPDFYNRLKSSYDQHFFQQEVLGDYLNVNAGAVYHAFSRERNIKECVVKQGTPILWTLDFNVDPMCSLIAQRDGDEIYVLDEIRLHRASTYQTCEEFHNRIPQHLAGVIVYGDATGGRAQTSGTSDHQIVSEWLRRSGFSKSETRFRRSNPSVRERVQLVNSMLMTADSRIRLYVSPKCQELITDLEEVSYKQDSAVIDKERDPRRTHLSDALGYLVWEERGPHTEVSRGDGRLFW